MEYQEIPEKIAKLARNIAVVEYNIYEIKKISHGYRTVEVFGRSIQVEVGAIAKMLAGQIEHDTNSIAKLQEVSDVLAKVANPLLQDIK